ncbi:efflux RND transporter permease subunit [Candidatus Sumerlaeota bacterium]|nr:efflux RND transporter permease subunit [Candidatus Sumerlaeota bacterium]
MNFKNFIENPIKVSMFFMALILMGYLSYRKLPLNLFPDIQTPRITVIINTKGLTPEETERTLTSDIERQLASIKGVSEITSYSREGSIVLHVDFHWGQDMEFAYLDVKKNVGTLETKENVAQVDVYRFDPNSEPLLTLAFTLRKTATPSPSGETSTMDERVDRVQVTSLVENVLRPKLETVKGVAYVKTNGARYQEVSVLLNEDIMSQYRLTTDAVMNAIKRNNISAMGGHVIEGNEQMVLKFISKFENVDDIRKCLITLVEGYPLHLEDLGDIRIDFSRDEVRVHQDGVETVTMDIYREPDVNAVQTARLVRNMVMDLNRRGNLGIKIAVDRSLEVETAIRELINNALIGMILAMIVLWVFLRNLRATIITGVAIPISIIATFSLMHFQGLSLNIMTLGGLALAAGMLVDNGIVVIENIFRHRVDASSPIEAACIGAKEVALAITAATLTTIVVFVPLVYVHGIAGILFRDQALTVVYSLLVSLLVGLVLLPMLAARIRKGRVYEQEGLTRFYNKFLTLSLKMRWLLLLLFLFIMGATWRISRDIPMRFFPESVAGRFSLLLEMPLGTSLERTEEVATRMEEPLLSLRYRDEELAPLLEAYEEWTISGMNSIFIRSVMEGIADLEVKNSAHPAIAELKEILLTKKWGNNLQSLISLEEAEKDREKIARKLGKYLGSFILVQSVTTTVGMESGSVSAAGEKILGSHSSRMEVVLNPNILKELDAKDIIDLLRSKAKDIRDLKCSFESRNEYLQQLLGKERGDVAVEVHAESLQEIRESTVMVYEAMKNLPGLVNIRTNLILGEEEYLLEPDRDAMKKGRFEISDINAQIQAYLKGEKSDKLKLDQGDMGIILKSPRVEEDGLEGLMNLQIVSSQGYKEKLVNLVRLRRERGIREIMRINQERTLLVMADLENVRYQDAVDSIRETLDRLPWVSGAYWNHSGEEVQRRDSFQKLFFALVISVILVYMVIAAILESLIHPLTIMLSIPFAASGVVFGFLITKISMNLMGYIGIVMLTGIVVNNAIVLMDRIRQVRSSKNEAGTLFEAVVQAGCQRLRPILMTSLTTILALLPLAMGFGEGAELRRPLAVAVMGGLVSSTLLTLWFLPGIYLCVEDALSVFRRALRWIFVSKGKKGEDAL